MSGILVYLGDFVTSTLKQLVNVVTINTRGIIKLHEMGPLKFVSLKYLST